MSSRSTAALSTSRSTKDHERRGCFRTRTRTQPVRAILVLDAIALNHRCTRSSWMRLRGFMSSRSTAALSTSRSTKDHERLGCFRTRTRTQPVRAVLVLDAITLNHRCTRSSWRRLRGFMSSRSTAALSTSRRSKDHERRAAFVLVVVLSPSGRFSYSTRLR